MLDDDQISLVNSAGNRTIIGELEALAIVVGLESIALQFSGCDIIVFVDNESALAPMIKVGSSNDFMCAASLVVADLSLNLIKTIRFGSRGFQAIPILLTILQGENYVVSLMSEDPMWIYMV